MVITPKAATSLLIDSLVDCMPFVGRGGGGGRDVCGGSGGTTAAGKLLKLSALAKGSP